MLVLLIITIFFFFYKKDFKAETALALLPLKGCLISTLSKTFEGTDKIDLDSIISQDFR